MTLRAASGERAATAHALFIAALMMLTAAATAFLKPAPPQNVAAPDLEAMTPDAFGEWRRIPIADAVLPQESEAGPGEAAAYRAYRDSAGRVITLVIAYGPPLGDSVRLHRPESCYVAQGYEIRKRSVTPFEEGGVDARLVQLSTASPSREEQVTYWLRSGAKFVTSPEAAQVAAFTGGARADGALVRVSSTGADPLLFDVQKRFLSAFAAALTPEARLVLLGAGEASS